MVYKACIYISRQNERGKARLPSDAPPLHALAVYCLSNLSVYEIIVVIVVVVASPVRHALGHGSSSIVIEVTMRMDYHCYSRCAMSTSRKNKLAIVIMQSAMFTAQAGDDE